MTEPKSPFIHARVTVELPFDLSVPSGSFPLRLGASSTALIVIVTSDPSWVIGYSKSQDAEGTPLLSATNEVGIASLADDKNQKIAEWVKKSNLVGAAIVPANTVLELRIGFGEKDGVPDVHEFSQRDETQKIIVFAVNQFISRYQVASGFRPTAGIVGAVSLLELRHLSVQIFKDDAPISPRRLVIPALPTQSVKRRVATRPATLMRFEHALRAPAIPLWLDLAHDAHSALHRGRNEQSVIGWIQALEVAISMIEEKCKVKPSGKPTIEIRLAQCLNACNFPRIEESLHDEIKFARQLRNKIIHEGKRLPFSDTQAERVSAAMIPALAIAEKMLFKLLCVSFDDGNKPNFAVEWDAPGAERPSP